MNGTRIITRVILVLAVMLVCGKAYAQDTGLYADRSRISVNGEAVVNVQPDKIVVTLGIETWDNEIGIAKQKNNDILLKALAVIKGVGVPEKEIQTDHLSIEPRYKDSYRKENFLGYFVRNTVVATLTDVGKVEGLITEVLEAGVNYIHGIDFQTTEFKKYREQARELALLAAKEKAEKMTAVLGRSIGAPLQISENYSGSGSRYYSGWGYSRNMSMSQNTMQNIDSGSSGVSETLALGKIAIRASVSVTFNITE